MTLFQAILVEFTGDCLSAVVNVVNVAGALVVQTEDWPEGFDFSFAFVGLVFGWGGCGMLSVGSGNRRGGGGWQLGEWVVTFTHFAVEFVEGWFDEVPSFWGFFAASFYFWHLWRGGSRGGWWDLGVGNGGREVGVWRMERLEANVTDLVLDVAWTASETSRSLGEVGFSILVTLHLHRYLFGGLLRHYKLQ